MRKIKIFLLFLFLLSLFCSNAFAYRIMRFTDGNVDNYIPSLHDGKMTWYAYDGHYWQIFFWNGKKTIQITNSNYDNKKPSVFNGQLAWYADTKSGPNSSHIFFWDGESTRQISDPKTYNNKYPVLSNGKIVWQGSTKCTGSLCDRHIFYWDGTSSRIISEEGSVSSYPTLSNGNAFWVDTIATINDICQWKGESVIHLYAAYYPAASYLHNFISVDGDYMVWFSRGFSPKPFLEMTAEEIEAMKNSENDYEIYYRHGLNTPTKITNNEFDDECPAIFQGKIVWKGYDGNDWEIFYWNGTETIQLTNNGTNDLWPTINNDLIVWSGFDGKNYQLYYLCPLEGIIIDKQPLMPEDTAQVKANFNALDPQSVPGPVIWSIKPKEGDAQATIDTETGVITNVSGKGWMSVRAEYPECLTCNVEADIQIGCEDCNNNVCKVPGTGILNLESIATRLRLGVAEEGKPAGNIFLRSNKPSPILATPKGLEYSTLSGNEKALFQNNDLRQVITPETFVDIVTHDPYSYTIFFYKPEARGNLINGFYEVISGSIPIASWKIENPDASSTVYNRLRLTETRGTDIKVHEYLFDSDQNIWSLSKGNGLQVIAKKTEINDLFRVVTETIKDNAGIPAFKKKVIYKTIEYSGTTKEVIVEEVQDPDNDALTTTSTYYEGSSCPTGSCGRLQSQVNPDGSWINYQYDALSRKIMEISSYLDVVPTTDPATARAIYYDYMPLTGDSNKPEDKYRPRKITEKVLGNTVSLTYYNYQVATNGERTEIMEQAAGPSAAYGAAGNQRTITVTNPYSATLPNSWKTKRTTYPDGKLDTYTYEYGTYTPNGTQPGAFAPGTGRDIRTAVTHGTVSAPAGISNKTTREISIVNPFGREQMRETQVYGGWYYDQIQWNVTLYDANNRISDVYSSDGTHQETTWGCCNLEAEIDSQGIQTLYASYDGLGRLLTKIKKGTDTIPDIAYTYTYDAAGRRLSETVSSTGLSLSTGQTYDLSGRVKTSMDSSGLVTTYAYSLNGLQTTVTRPGGVTEITNRYLDGRIKSITGSGVIPKYYEYTVQADGSQSTQVYNGSQGSVSWEKSTTDMLGRTLKTEKPGFTGTEITQYFYNTKSQLIKISQPGLADTLHEYDSLGNQTRTGLDQNANGILDNNSLDRIAETLTSYAKPDANWWQESVQKVYSQENNAAATTVSTQRTRVTGLGTNGLVNETLSIDINDNQTIARSTLDPSLKSLSQSIDYPDSTINAETVNVNGLIVSQQSKSGNITGFEYDALGRRTGIIDPRTGKVVTHYNALNQVDYMQDPAGNIASYTYEALTGRKQSETNSLNKTTYYSYNNLGQVIRVWGAAEPVEYVYDAYGRLSELHTFRQGSNWQSPTWPEGQTGATDVTRWHYQESTGLLTSKEYVDGKATAYTYSVGGKLLTRTWARLNQGNPLATTYTYDPTTGELLNIDYSDSTPDVTFTYDRLGRQKTVQDYVGTRTFGYNPNTLQLETEAMTGLMNKTITRTYETTGVPGRNIGFSLGTDYNVNYGYEINAGRFASVGWNATGKTDTVNYTYWPNSDLISGFTSSKGLKTTYAFEINRNLKTQVRNEFGTNVVSQYSYAYDTIARRTSMDTSGSAPWGNANFISGTSNYITNNLNQYTQITQNPEPVTQNLTYDEDGNLVSIIKESEGTKYFYNAENQLTKVEPLSPVINSKKVEFAYDYMGRRVEKKVFNYVAGDWQLMTDSLFLYDGWNLISELSAPSSPFPAQKFFIWGLDLSQSLQGAGGVGGLIAAVDNGETYHYFYDGNGNVVQLMKASDGLIAAHYEYDPYGNVIVKSGLLANENPIRFSTKFFDDETGLGYWGYRHYSPSLGRWINRDPSEEEGGQNLYAYVSNDTINNIDPLGLWTLMHTASAIDNARAKAGDALAAERTTWELWEAKCGDTIWSLAEILEIDFHDWPQWLSLEKAAPGVHSLPNQIQPGDIYKAKRYAALIGTAIPKAVLAAKGMDGIDYFNAFTNDEGKYGFIRLNVKRRYMIFYEGGFPGLDALGGQEAYTFSFIYGEVRILNFRHLNPKRPYWIPLEETPYKPKRMIKKGGQILK